MNPQSKNILKHISFCAVEWMCVDVRLFTSELFGLRDNLLVFFTKSTKQSNSEHCSLNLFFRVSSPQFSKKAC